MQNIKIHPIQTGLVRVPRCQAEGAKSNLHRLAQIFIKKEWTDWLPIFCYLIEHPDGLFLIDSGEISAVNKEGFLPDNPVFRSTVRYKVSRADEVDNGVRKLGFQLPDVKRIFLTHLHSDHMDGIIHFPEAEVNVSDEAWRAMSGKNPEKIGYLRKNLPRGFNPEVFTLNESGTSFTRSRILLSDGSLTAVALPGHSPGHTGYILKTCDKTYIFTGDASFNSVSIAKGLPFAVLDNPDARRSAAALAAFSGEQKVLFLPAHDPQVSAFSNI